MSIEPGKAREEEGRRVGEEEEEEERGIESEQKLYRKCTVYIGMVLHLQELAPTAVNLKDNEGRTSESYILPLLSTLLSCHNILTSLVALHLAVAAGNVPVMEALVSSFIQLCLCSHGMMIVVDLLAYPAFIATKLTT